MLSLLREGSTSIAHAVTSAIVYWADVLYAQPAPEPQLEQLDSPGFLDVLGNVRAPTSEPRSRGFVFSVLNRIVSYTSRSKVKADGTVTI